MPVFGIFVPLPQGKTTCYKIPACGCFQQKTRKQCNKSSLMKSLEQVGKYFELLSRVFSKPERHSIYVRQVFNEIDNLGVKSVGIVAVISIFMGGIMTLQVAYNLKNPLLPIYLIGLGTRDTLILEFSSTILALIMARKQKRPPIS